MVFMIQAATKTKIFDRFMRTNVPSALFQTWVDVRMRLGLVAVASVVTPSPRVVPEGASWIDIAPHTPPTTADAIRAFVDDFSGPETTRAAADGGHREFGPLRSGVSFRMSRHPKRDDGYPGRDRLFDADGEKVIDDVVVIPGLPADNADLARALIFFSGVVLDADEVRFLHAAAGIHFTQQALWEAGQQREPAVALKPREIECIRWAVTGRTLAEIAGIMRLSYRTVRFHLDSARARYGFSTNQQLFVQAAKDYGLDPENTPGAIRRERTVIALPPLRRMQPLWDERRGAFDRRVGDRRQVIVLPLPFADRRKTKERRSGERRAVVPSAGSSAEAVLTPEELRALLN